VATTLVVILAAGTALWLALTLLLSAAQPVAGPFVRCAGDCPRNPFVVGDGVPGVGSASAVALGLWTAAAAVGTAVLLARRMRSATALERRSLDPVLAWTALASLGYGVYIAVRVVDSDAALLGRIGTVIAVILTLIPIALGAALVRGRVFAASALRRTVLALGERTSPERLRVILVGAFRDPSLELVFWLPAVDGYVDELGGPVQLPVRGAGRALTRFDRDGRPVAG